MILYRCTVHTFMSTASNDTSVPFGFRPSPLKLLSIHRYRVRLLFFDLFLLGIDSAFSFVEGFSTVAHDTQYFNKTPKWQIAGVLSLVGWLIGLMYTTDAGLAWLDVIDFYINFTMLIVGFFESKCTFFGVCLLCVFLYKPIGDSKSTSLSSSPIPTV